MGRLSTNPDCVPWTVRTAPNGLLRTVLATVAALAVAAGCAPLPPDQPAADRPADERLADDPRRWPGAGITPESTGDPGARDAMRHTRSEMFELEREAARSMQELGIRPAPPGARAGAYTGRRTDQGALGEMTGEMIEMQRKITDEQQEIIGTFPELFIPEGRRVHPYYRYQQHQGR